MLDHALHHHRPGAYQVQAAIAACHATAGVLPAARADLLRRLDRKAEAAVSYREALELCAGDAERRFLTRRLNEVQCST